ncbi:MAG: four-helix bundle copper-binding protein [Spirochaetia bacterium]|nr:four-helix bundle copper-binding protein [Spirochaetia bacterium]
MKKLEKKINRKKFLAGAAGIAATALASKLWAVETNDPHEHHHQHGSSKNAALIAAANDCTGKAEICLDHCISTLKEKDLSLVDCMTSVRDMIPLCQGLSSLAASESKYLANYMKICITACDDCIKACKKHADKHQVCADCAEACKKCADECRKLAA